MQGERYIRFDWAVKRMLRDKANFCVLEGLLTVLLNEKITISELLESEANQESYNDKFNRVDVKAINSKGEIIIVEVQLTREVHFLERIIYGVSKTICDHISLGEDYSKIKKIYSINILYFDLGRGKDFLYHGKTEFTGVFAHDKLLITKREKNAIPSNEGLQYTISTNEASKIFPEYYLIRVNEFNDYAKTPIEEWIAYLKNGVIDENTTTPGLQEARKKLNYLAMTPQERAAYELHLDNLRIENDVVSTAKMDGWEEGRLEGRKEGREEGRLEGREEGKEEGREKGRLENKLDTVKKMKSLGFDVKTIAKITDLSISDIENI